MRNAVLILTGWIIFAFGLSAQDVILKATISRDSILIGEQVIYRLTLEYSGKAAMEWPRFSDTLGHGKIEILKTGDFSESGNENKKIRQQEITITCFDSGYYAIPPSFVVMNGDTIESNPLLLEVHTVEVDTTKAIRDIKEIYEEEFTFAEYLQSLWQWMKDNWYYFAGGAVLAGLLLFLLLRKKKNDEKPAVPALPEDVEALQKLKELDNKKLWQDGKIKEYYVELTDIIRNYIERRFKVPALEQTTDEIMHSLRFAEIKDENRHQLKALLKTSDLVKFAKEKPAGTENEQALKVSVDFIESTRIIKHQEEKE
ncbi:MAG: LPXTG cell wall anchor domain-containing protein [Bacteroidota bacterium]